MSSKCSKGVCHVKECFDGKCKTYEKKQPPKFEFQKPDSHWNGKTSPALDKAKKDDKGAVDSIGKPNAPAKGDKAPTMKDPAAVFGDQDKQAEPKLTVSEKATPSSTGASTTKTPIDHNSAAQNENLQAINSIINEVKNKPPTESNKILLDGIVDDTMIDMDIYSGKKTKEAADILKNKEFAMVKSSEIEQEMVQTDLVLENIEKLLAKNKK